MVKREDRRITMTKRLLKEALTELLKQSDIYHISVRELCQQADVNRTTFYKYYGSPFELLGDMEKDLLDFLAATITENASSPEKIIEAACVYMEAHLDFVRLIVNNNVDPQFPRKLAALAEVREAVLQNREGRWDEGALEYLYNYITYGAYRIICMWLNKDRREPISEIAALLARLIQASGLKDQ